MLGNVISSLTDNELFLTASFIYLKKKKNLCVVLQKKPKTDSVCPQTEAGNWFQIEGAVKLKLFTQHPQSGWMDPGG